MRPSFGSIYMSTAEMLSRRSTCLRAKVGCLIVTVDNTQILSVGYNGGAKGVDDPCSANAGSCCVHAEANALVKLPYDHPAEKRLICTTEPCKMCAMLIVNAGIEHVVYLRPYRLHDGLDLLVRAGIKVLKFEGSLLIPSEDEGTDEKESDTA